jgi:hypothetical protein
MAAPGPQPICNYGSVTLSPGQQFTLPPGAVLVSATSTSAFTSTCPIPPLEVPECYIITFNFADDLGSATSVAWSNDTSTFDGINVGGTFYDFGVGTGAWIGAGGQPFTQDIADFIKNDPVLKNILTCTGWANSQDAGQEGGGGTICFKAIPSLGNTINIKVTTFAPGHGSSFALFPARPLATYTQENKCNCNTC